VTMSVQICQTVVDADQTRAHATLHRLLLQFQQAPDVRGAGRPEALLGLIADLCPPGVIVTGYEVQLQVRHLDDLEIWTQCRIGPLQNPNDLANDGRRVIADFAIGQPMDLERQISAAGAIDPSLEPWDEVRHTLVLDSLVQRSRESIDAAVEMDL